MQQQHTNQLIVLSDGVKVEFPSRLQGKHKIYISKVKASVDTYVDYIDKYPEVLNKLAESIIDKEGKPFEITSEYLMQLDIKDYEKLIDNGLDALVIRIGSPKARKKA